MQGLMRPAAAGRGQGLDPEHPDSEDIKPGALRSDV